MKEFNQGIRVIPSKHGCIMTKDTTNKPFDLVMINESLTFTSWRDFRHWAEDYSGYMEEFGGDANDLLLDSQIGVKSEHS